MRGLLQASALRPSCHAMPAHPVPCTTMIRCVADTGAKPGPHGLRPPARKGLPLGQPHREFTHHLPQAAALLDSLEVQTSSLQDAMDDLLLDSRMLAEQRRLLEVNFAGRDAEEPEVQLFHFATDDLPESSVQDDADDRTAPGEVSVSGRGDLEQFSRPRASGRRPRAPKQSANIAAGTIPTSRGSARGSLNRTKRAGTRTAAMPASGLQAPTAGVAKPPVGVHKSLEGTREAAEYRLVTQMAARLQKGKFTPDELVSRRKRARQVQGVTAFLTSLGHTAVLTKQAEFDLAEIVQKGLRVNRRAEALSLKLGRAPTASELAVDVKLKNAAHVKLLLANTQVARTLMIQHNTRLVVSIAKNFSGRGVDLQDLIVEGLAGLMRAVDRFDAKRGFKFSTYAYWWIRQAVSRSVVDEGTVVRLPLNVYDLARRIRRISLDIAETGARYGNKPTAEEVAAAVKLPAEKVQKILQLSQTPRSLEEPVYTVNSANGKELQSYSDIITDEDVDTDPEQEALEDEKVDIMRSEMNACLAMLAPRERNVLRMRYGLHTPDGTSMSLHDVSAAYGISKERIRQIEHIAFTKLASPARMRLSRPEIWNSMGELVMVGDN